MSIHIYGDDGETFVNFGLSEQFNPCVILFAWKEIKACTR